MKYLHKHLCMAATQYLEKNEKCSFSVSEMVTWAGQIPDCIGFKSSGSYLVEVKVSRGDFIKDKSKNHQIAPYKSMGNFRYYLCPSNIITVNDLPENWGLLYWENDKINRVKSAVRQESNINAEWLVLVSIIRRMNHKQRKVKGYENTYNYKRAT